MTDSRTARTLLVSDHLWQLFGQMAAEMGSDRDGLVNQALFAFARRNGYVVPGALRDAAPPESKVGLKRPRRSALPALRPASETSGARSAQAPAPEAAREPTASARAPAQNGSASAKGRTLVLLADGREIDRIAKSRFVIGRGKHCDLVIQSGKVSREHAAISREGDAWFIEDLGSSNGTWFDQRRITRRQIREGDEYFISAERLSCVFR